jgi:hypothetical protein
MADNVVAEFKGIKAAVLRTDVIRLELLNALRSEGRAAVREFKKTVATWNEEKPDFDFLIGLSGSSGGATVVIGATGDEKGVKKWTWLNEGTRIRWALMSKDWRSKTTPYVLESGPGMGRVVIRGRMAMLKRHIPPQPGIEPREWTRIIAERRKEPFRRLVIDAINRGRAKMFTGGSGL